MSLIRRERRQWIPEPVVPPFPGAAVGGRMSSPTTLTAMQSSAVWACVALVARTVSMMPLKAYTLRNGVRVPTGTPTLLKAPAAGCTLPDWVYMIMASLLLRGNAYGRIVRRDALGYPLQIELLNPDKVQPRRDPDTGTLGYYVNGNRIPDGDLFHARAYRMPGYDMGLSPIQQAATEINRDNAIQQFSLGYFEDAPNPASVLTSDQPIGGEEAKIIKDRLIATVQGREPLVLGAGLKFTPLSVSPEESQFLLTQQYGSSEICRFFGVPPRYVPGAFVGGNLTYSTPVLDALDLLTFTIQWWLTNLEANFAPLFPGKQHVQFDPDVLLRTDIETLMKSTAIGIASKQMDPDEARALRNEPPLTDEQKQWLDIVPLTVSPTGLPKSTPVAAEGEPA